MTDSPQPTDLDVAPATVYEDGLRRGELLYQRCLDCSHAVFFPRVGCPYCGSAHLTWSRSLGRGEVYASTTVRRREESYNVALIDLEEGFRMMATVRGVEPDQVGIGARVGARLYPGMGTDDLTFLLEGRS